MMNQVGKVQEKGTDYIPFQIEFGDSFPLKYLNSTIY